MYAQTNKYVIVNCDHETAYEKPLEKPRKKTSSNVKFLNLRAHVLPRCSALVQTCVGNPPRRGLIMPRPTSATPFTTRPPTPSSTRSRRPSPPFRSTNRAPRAASFGTRGRRTRRFRSPSFPGRALGGDSIALKCAGGDDGGDVLVLGGVGGDD